MAILEWEGCFNVRDVGGLPTEDGDRLRAGVLVRSDALVSLAPRGWRSLRAAEVARVVDLRYLSMDPVAPPDGLALEVRRVELYPDDPVYWERAHGDLENGASLGDYLAWQYLNALQTRGPQLADAVMAIAGASAGAVVVHCQAGKDRTGIVAALVLRLAGVPIAAATADYALSASHGWRALERWVGEAADGEERSRRERLSGAPAEAMERTLVELDRRWGGAEQYLRGHGAEPAALARLRARLRGEEAPLRPHS